MAASIETSTVATRDALEIYAAAWLSGDLRQIASCYHDDFTLHYFGANALSGDHVGKARSLEILAEFSRRTRRRLLTVRPVIAGGEHGALIAREALMKDDAAIEVERVLVYRVVDGLLAECWVYDRDQRLIDSIIG